MPQKIIIDADPGVDDIFTIFFALQSPELEVLGISAVFGNGGVQNTTYNAIRVVETAGIPDIPVAMGAERPLIIKPRFGGGAGVHGADGLGNAGDRLPQPKGKPVDRRAAQFIIDTVMAHPGEVYITPLGPLTNVALAALIEPRIVGKVKGISLMGGAAFSGGNITAVAEANIRNDPHAAHIVFSAGWPVTMAGWDVNAEFMLNQKYMDHLTALNNPASNFLREIYPCLRDALQLPEESIDLPDLLAVAYLVDPTLFTVERYPVYVETEGYAAGQTIADRRRRPRETPGYVFTDTDILMHVDAERLRKLYYERIAKYS
ncbi:MAG: nucleoside hydrolase [Anaerolineae bacterium]|nr:nucleoside hydrolase [Anaerolineae bacterium]